MDAREFERTLTELKEHYHAAGENTQSYQLVDCRHCGSCMFCKGCDSCHRCTYCESCAACSHSTHCESCVNCHSCAYCTSSNNCVGSKYLEQCESCADCTYCFGCVGLSRKDFHILNEPYDRNTYFQVVAALKKQLRLK
jgi:hypothetical protein